MQLATRVLDVVNPHFNMGNGLFDPIGFQLGTMVNRIGGLALLKRALEQRNMAWCFGQADEALYGADFAYRSIQEAEDNLRQVASNIIAGNY